MQTAMHVYPWNLREDGVDSVLARMRDHGFDSFNLAATYHPIATFNPHGVGTKLHYDVHGAVYFPARLERYGAIKPRIWPDDSVTRTWSEAAQRLSRYGLTTFIVRAASSAAPPPATRAP